jgi:hypothetical protein
MKIFTPWAARAHKQIARPPPPLYAAAMLWPQLLLHLRVGLFYLAFTPPCFHASCRCRSGLFLHRWLPSLSYRRLTLDSPRAAPPSSPASIASKANRTMASTGLTRAIGREGAAVRDKEDVVLSTTVAFWVLFVLAVRFRPSPLRMEICETC